MSNDSLVERYPEPEMPAQTPRRVRVLVADDHPAMRRALARLVREHEQLELVGEAADGEEAIAMLDQLIPDVALLDVRMPRGGGLGLPRRLPAEPSTVP